MTIPTLILCVVVSSLCGLLFHLIMGGRAGRILLYLVLSWFGFTLGQLLADKLGWSFINFGAIHVDAALGCTLAFLLLGHWLSLAEYSFKETPGHKNGT